MHDASRENKHVKMLIYPFGGVRNQAHLCLYRPRLIESCITFPFKDFTIYSKTRFPGSLSAPMNEIMKKTLKTTFFVSSSPLLQIAHKTNLAQSRCQVTGFCDFCVNVLIKTTEYYYSPGEVTRSMSVLRMGQNESQIPCSLYIILYW